MFQTRIQGALLNLTNQRIGYLAAALSFRQDTQVLMLCTNLIKKDLASNNYLESAIAMHTLAQIVTPDLARDLCQDLVNILKHSNPGLRKRAILVLFRMFVKYPESLRSAFPRLRERLEDPDPAVVAAAANVICELATRNPKSYLPLAPVLYNLLTTSLNNWMLIKIVKLVRVFTGFQTHLIVCSAHAARATACQKINPTII